MMLVGQGAEAYEDIGQGEIKRRSRGRAIAQRRMHIWPALQRRILRLCTWRCQCHPTGRETFCILPRWDIDAAQLRKAKETLPFPKRSLHLNQARNPCHGPPVRDSGVLPCFETEGDEYKMIGCMTDLCLCAIHRGETPPCGKESP